MRKNSVLTKSISHHVPEIFRFCKHANECLMTSSTQHRPNKLPQMKDISCNNCAYCNVSFIGIVTKLKIMHTLD